MSELKTPNYPRSAGSSTVVNESDWAQDAPYGHCPACGNIAMEEMETAGDPDVTFFCSDPTCLTVMGSRSPARTKWYNDKSEKVIQKEIHEGYSWNEDHFPGQRIPIVCPD